MTVQDTSDFHSILSSLEICWERTKVAHSLLPFEGLSFAIHPKVLEGRGHGGMVAPRRGIYKFIKHFVETGSILRRRCSSGGPTKTTPEIKHFDIDEQMEKPLNHLAQSHVFKHG